MNETATPQIFSTHQQFEQLKRFNANYAIRERPLLNKLRDRWYETKPLAGLRALHNIPLTYETAVKLESLLAAGADLTVTHSDFMDIPYKTEVVEYLKSIQVKWFEKNTNINGEFDIVLDCTAQIAKNPNIQIKQGLVELTQSGTTYFKTQKPNYPVFSVDDSHLKNLEAKYGTGESFVRAIKEKSCEKDLTNKLFIVFGFGKVGTGIVKYLALEKAHVVVVENDSSKLEKIKQKDIEVYDFNQVEIIKRLAKSAFCIVTATGNLGMLSTLLEEKDCGNALLANMGTHDEFGANFTPTRVLAEKSTINFHLKHPTLMQFIDPIMYAHNIAAELITQQNLAPGYYSFPKELDREIINEWSTYYKTDVQDVFED